MHRVLVELIDFADVPFSLYSMSMIMSKVAWLAKMLYLVSTSKSRNAVLKI